jgi:hypothetical protein
MCRLFFHRAMLNLRCLVRKCEEDRFEPGLLEMRVGRTFIRVFLGRPHTFLLTSARGGFCPCSALKRIVTWVRMRCHGRFGGFRAGLP